MTQQEDHIDFSTDFADNISTNREKEEKPQKLEQTKEWLYICWWTSYDHTYLLQIAKPRPVPP